MTSLSKVLKADMPLKVETCIVNDRLSEWSLFVMRGKPTLQKLTNGHLTIRYVTSCSIRLNIGVIERQE